MEASQQGSAGRSLLWLGWWAAAVTTNSSKRAVSTCLDCHRASRLEESLAADERQQAAACAAPRQLRAALRQDGAVHLRYRQAAE